jgi:hypothetical protein
VCPVDKIWSAAEGACVALDPTAEPTATTAPTATIEPTATSDSEPTIPVDDQTAPPTEVGGASPEASHNDQFFLEDWWDELTSFDAPSGLSVWEATCDQVIAPTDSLEEIIARCRTGTQGFTYDVFVDGRLVETFYNGGGFWRSDLPGGDYRIVSRYNLEHYKTPYGACAAWDNDQEEPIYIAGPGQLPMSGDLIAPDVPAEADQMSCIFYYIPILKTDVTVDLIAYYCPQAVVDQHLVNYRDLVVQCGVPGPDVEMQVLHTREGGSVGFTHLGLASFTGYGAGSIRVREVIPEGYGYPLVYCTVTGPDGQTIKQQDLEVIQDDGWVTVADVPPGSSVLCEVFNVPGETPEYDGPPVTWQQEDTASG